MSFEVGTAPPAAAAAEPAEPPAIEVRGVSKAYNVYAQPIDRLRQAVLPRLAQAARRLGLPVRQRPYFTLFNALHNLSFEVARGETVGVIGRNGAGKSTLLQIVCGTLTPSSGEAVVRGRVAALLELGSGFNPEYTGRENVFLNASVLGLTRAQTEERLDDILRFADIGEFVDQPVKTYSSGMAMRLAFAVIAHVDADVLIVDEALAVGDAYFQQKCLRWLRAFRERGTVLFCGHDLGAVMSFCNRAIWLDKGQVRLAGGAKEVCEAYMAFVQAEAMGLGEGAVRLAGAEEEAAAEEAADGAPPPPPEADQPLGGSSSFGNGDGEIVGVSLRRADGSPLAILTGDEELELQVRVRGRDRVPGLIVGFHVADRLGRPIFGENTFATTRADPPALEPGRDRLARFRFKLPWLISGTYTLTVSAAAGTLEHHVQLHMVHDVLAFTVASTCRYDVLMAMPMLAIALEEIGGATPAAPSAAG